MAYYIFIEDNKINGAGQGRVTSPDVEILNYEVSEELYNAFNVDPDKYMWDIQSYSVIENPDYEKIKQQKEQARIMEMKMTPLDFLKAIEQYGITYDMVKQFMEENPLVERELRFCQFVYRKHPMLQSLSEYGITSEILDHIFKVANGEEE